MAEQIIINVVRPEVGIEYRQESPESELSDRLATSKLALHALAQNVRDLHAMLGLVCPPEIENLAESDIWRSGM